MDRIDGHSNRTSSSATISKGSVLFVVESCIFLALDISAFVGNLLVCLAVYRNKSLRTITNIFILSLALNDLLMALLIIPLNTAASFAGRWIFGGTGCQFVGACAHGWAGISLLTLTSVAVNRYIRVVRPNIYSKIYSKKRSIIMVVLTWIVTAAVVGILFPAAGIKFEAKFENPAVVSPFFSTRNAFLLFHIVHIIYIILPSVVIATCYLKVFQKIRQHNKSVSPSLQCRECGNNGYGVEEAKVTKLLAIVLVGFYLCWLPCFVTITLRLFNAIKKAHEVYSNFYYLFPAYTSSVINPVIYATMSEQFRAEFVNILRRK